MTAEQVEQWKRERDIAYQTKNEDAIKAVEQHRVEMLMDCQMKTATRVKNLIKQQSDLADGIKELKEEIKTRDEKLDAIAKQSEETDKKISENFGKFNKFVQDQKLKEAEFKGGLKGAKWLWGIISAILGSGIGAMILKLWQFSQQVSQ